jgi:hypothetical protein
MILNYFRLRNPMFTILKEAINVGLKLCSTSVTQTFNLSCLIQVRNWTVSTGLSVFTGLENVRSEPTNRRPRTSD